MVNNFECICRGIDSAITGQDTVNRYRLVLVLLERILGAHSALVNDIRTIERRNASQNNLPTTLHSAEYYHTSGRGWGRNRSSGRTVGSSGNQLRKITDIASTEERRAYMAETVVLQFAYNADLETLQQYANQFATYRKGLLELKPRNKVQRMLQNLLMISKVNSGYNGSQNPMLGTINGTFAARVCIPGVMYKLIRVLDDKNGLIGRQSFKCGADTITSSTNWHMARKAPANGRAKGRYTGTYSKGLRCENVSNYVTNSARYKRRHSWVRDIRNVGEALELLPVVDDWKEQYSSTNKLAYINAINVSPYVRSIVCSQLLLVGQIVHMETSIPVYSGDCIAWSNSHKLNQKCYFLGKTGSSIIDGAVRSVDWYHTPITSAMSLSMSDTNTTALEYLTSRLNYMRNQNDTLKQRRKELASYARKLVWLESISMLDSKNAGNCLPGTLQFCQALGIPVPSQWSNVTIDTRLLLRRWKQNDYGVNRLLLPAIDTAVNRVKKQLLSVVACYVPSVVR